MLKNTVTVQSVSLDINYKPGRKNDKWFPPTEFEQSDYSYIIYIRILETIESEEGTREQPSVMSFNIPLIPLQRKVSLPEKENPEPVIEMLKFMRHIVATYGTYDFTHPVDKEFSVVIHLDLTPEEMDTINSILRKQKEQGGF